MAEAERNSFENHPQDCWFPCGRGPATCAWARVSILGLRAAQGCVRDSKPFVEDDTERERPAVRAEGCRDRPARICDNRQDRLSGAVPFGPSQRQWATARIASA